MKRKICVVTGSRAEYGLLQGLCKKIQIDPDLQLQIIATGMHLSPEFGLTYKNIEADGFTIDAKVEMLLSSDSVVGVSKSMGLGLIGFGEALQQLQPDLLVVLGDRFEIFSAVAAALIARIPVAHLHGGETTEGAMDEAIRHSITKMSHLHFVAAEEYKKRVLQLGENPDHVFMVGGLGVDSIQNLNLLSREELEKSLGIKLAAKNLLVTFHPVTLEKAMAEAQMTQLLGALEELKDTKLIFTMPNCDTDGRILFKMIEAFAAKNANAHVFTSLGQQRYFSCLNQVDGVVGNSSSGLAEAPTFKKGTINIGDRQKGRLKAQSVIDCLPEQKSIGQALQRLYSAEFQDKLKTVSNPYGDGGASARIYNVLAKIPLDDLVKKRFFDTL